MTGGGAVAAGVLVVGVVAGVVLFRPQSLSDDEPGRWHHPRRLYSLVVPDGWRARAQEADIVVLQGPSGAAYGIIHLGTEHADGRGDLDVLVGSLRGDTATRGAVAVDGRLTVDRGEYPLITYARITPNGEEVRAAKVAFDRFGRWWEFTLYAVPGAYAERFRDFAGVLASMRIGCVGVALVRINNC